MGGVEGGNLDSGGEVPGGIFNIVPLDRLFRPGGVSPSVVAVFPACNPRCQASLCSNGGVI